MENLIEHNANSEKVSALIDQVITCVQSPYKRGGGERYGQFLFLHFLHTFDVWSLPVVKDAQTKWRQCNETTAKR